MPPLSDVKCLYLYFLTSGYQVYILFIVTVVNLLFTVFIANESPLGLALTTGKKIASAAPEFHQYINCPNAI